MENITQVFPVCLLQIPAGKAFGYGVHPCDFASDVSGNHCISDGIQRDTELFLAFLDGLDCLQILESGQSLFCDQDGHLRQENQCVPEFFFWDDRNLLECFQICVHIISIGFGLFPEPCQIRFFKKNLSCEQIRHMLVADYYRCDTVYQSGFAFVDLEFPMFIQICGKLHVALPAMQF